MALWAGTTWRGLSRTIWMIPIPSCCFLTNPSVTTKCVSLPKNRDKQPPRLSFSRLTLHVTQGI